jgi:hypothetical protein
MKMKKEKMSSQLSNLIKEYSENKCTLKEALDRFETLMIEYSNLIGEDGNTNMVLIKNSLESFKEKIELINQLKKDYEKNYEENMMLKKKLGIIG